MCQLARQLGTVSALSTVPDLNTEIFTAGITFDLWVSDLFSGPPREAEGPHPLWEDGAQSNKQEQFSGLFVSEIPVQNVSQGCGEKDKTRSDQINAN